MVPVIYLFYLFMLRHGLMCRVASLKIGILLPPSLELEAFVIFPTFRVSVSIFVYSDFLSFLEPLLINFF